MPAGAPLSSVRSAARAGLLLTLLLAACTRQVELVRLADGSVLAGTHRVWDGSMTLALPGGEAAQGFVTKLTTADIGKESLFFGANAGELLGLHRAERIYGYARLAGDRGTVVEIIFASDWLGHGFGVARTSAKEEYRVTF